MGITLPKVLFKITKEFFKTPRKRFPDLKEAMICTNRDWQSFIATVHARQDATQIAGSATQLAATLVQLIRDLEKGIGQYDAGLPADDLIRGTEAAISPCCALESKFVGILNTSRGVKWRMLCKCGAEWHN